MFDPDGHNVEAVCAFELLFDDEGVPRCARAQGSQSIVRGRDPAHTAVARYGSTESLAQERIPFNEEEMCAFPGCLFFLARAIHRRPEGESRRIRRRPPLIPFRLMPTIKRGQPRLARGQLNGLSNIFATVEFDASCVEFDLPPWW